MENVNLRINNYKYSEKQSKEIENKLEFLLKQIPCDSRVLLDFNYKDKVFYGKLKVEFHGKRFFSKDKNVVLVPLTGSLCKKIQKQVMKWKKSRTIEEITGIVSIKSSGKMASSYDFYSYKKAS